MAICRFYDTINEWEELQLIQQIYTQLLIRNNFLTQAHRGRGHGRGRGRGNVNGNGARGDGRGRGRGASGNRGRGRRQAISRPKDPNTKRTVGSGVLMTNNSSQKLNKPVT